MSTVTLDRFPDPVIIPCLPFLVVLGLLASFLPGSLAYGSAGKRAATRKVARPKKPQHGKTVTSKSTAGSAGARLGGSSSVGQKSASRSSSGTGAGKVGARSAGASSPATPAASANVPSVGAASVADPGLQGLSVEQQIVVLTNRDRQANGLSPLSVDVRLVTSAQIQASAMASFNDMDHQIPGETYPTFPDRLQFVGYAYSWSGENLAFNSADAPSVEALWMNSPPHRANILSPFPTSIGVAVDYDSKGEPYYCVVFGVPL